MSALADIGQHGGVALRPFMMGKRRLVKGDQIKPEEALAMPLNNRRSLDRLGWVRFHEEPQPEQSTSEGGTGNTPKIPLRGGRKQPGAGQENS
jgi:hypothetical protein